MSETKKISLLAALLINLNILIGAGIFLNIKPLSQFAGPLAPLSYALGGLALLPFVLSLAKLAQAYPVAGGIYIYSKQYLHPFLGFLSGWFYFIGKTVSAAFLAFAFTSFFHQRIPFLQQFPILLLATLVIFTLIALNILGAHIGGRIQYLFISTKIIPILFAFILGLQVFQPAYFSITYLDLSTLASTIPIAIYAMMGFEITCSIAHLIDNPQKNVFRAILWSFLLANVIYIIFQTIIFGALGSIAPTAEPFNLLAQKVFSNPFLGKVVTALVFTSIIAGSFGILTSNCWNLLTLAQDKYLPGEKLLTKISARNIPWFSLLIEGCLGVLLLAISENQIALQSMSVFGVFLSFVLSAVAAYLAARKSHIKIASWIPFCAILSCSGILFLCFQRIQHAGASVPYIILLISGILAAIFSKRQA